MKLKFLVSDVKVPFCQKLETASIVIGNNHDLCCLPVVIIRLEKVGSKKRPFTQNNKRYSWYTPDSYPEEIQVVLCY